MCWSRVAILKCFLMVHILTHCVHNEIQLAIVDGNIDPCSQKLIYNVHHRLHEISCHAFKHCLGLSWRNRRTLVRIIMLHNYTNTSVNHKRIMTSPCDILWYDTKLLSDWPIHQLWKGLTVQRANVATLQWGCKNKTKWWPKHFHLCNKKFEFVRVEFLTEKSNGLIWNGIHALIWVLCEDVIEVHTICVL